MRYLKSYQIFESSDPYHDIVIDALSDLSDRGYKVAVVDAEGNPKTLVVTISKPGIEYKRETNLGFKIEDVSKDIEELKSQLSDQKVKSVYYHIKGYEPSTWYSLRSSTTEEEPIDQLSIEFIGK